MGFSLVVFLSELRSVLEADYDDDDEKIAALKLVVDENETYAKQCGII